MQCSILEKLCGIIGWTFGYCVCIWHAHTEEPVFAISGTIFVVRVGYLSLTSIDSWTPI
jgi:hypothetical protein